MNELRIETRDRRTSYSPGESITGSLSWTLDGPPGSVELRLFWYTQGKGTQDISVEQVIPFDAPASTDRRDFSLTLPAAPYSFSGKLISLLWALELIAHPSGEVSRLDLTIAPNGREVLLNVSHESPR